MLASLVVSVTLALAALALWRVGAAVGGSIDASRAELARLADAWEGDAKTVRQEIRDLEDLVDRLPQRWDEIRKEAARLDSRARHHASRALRELAESGVSDTGLEAVGAELHLVDGGPGGSEGVPAVPPGVANGSEPDDLRGLSGLEYARAVMRSG